MGVAGAGSLAQVINAAIANKDRFKVMEEFFDGVGVGHATGVWDAVPVDRPDFKADVRRRLEKAAKKRKAEEMG
jgi:chlorophyllide a reductase subunit Y